MIVKSFTVDRLRVRISQTPKEMGQDAAHEFAQYLRATLLRQEHANVIFAAAPSQLDFLAALAQETDINWKRVRAFHMDEYIGIGCSAPQSFNRFVRKYVVDRLGVGEFYGLNGDAPDIRTECDRYDALLRTYPPDAVCLGIGENGHIAFNDPWEADLWDAHNVKTVRLDEKCRNQQVNDKCFARIEDVPASAVTLTVPMLMRTKAMFCVVPGTQKAEAVYRTVTSPIGADCPASALRLHADATLFCDVKSGDRLLSSGKRADCQNEAAATESPNKY